MMKKTTTLGATLADISAVIKTRRDGDVRESYTAQLLNDDGERLMKKIVEEAGELSSLRHLRGANGLWKKSPICGFIALC